MPYANQILLEMNMIDERDVRSLECIACDSQDGWSETRSQVRTTLRNMKMLNLHVHGRGGWKINKLEPSCME